MSGNLLERDVNDILRTALANAPGELFAVNPSADTIEELVGVMHSSDDPPTVNLLAEEGVLKDVMDDFIVASTAADLIEADRLHIRQLEGMPANSLLVTEDSVVAIVPAGDRVAGLTTEDGAFVEAAYDRYGSAWEDARTFSLRTPPLASVRDTLSEEIGPEVATDFDDVLSSLETARGDGDGLDEVTISLLVAARNEELLYDISKWGEDVGIASKATFSRTKTKLEDMGLIDTEKVPIDVGRPRLRLMLGDERLRGAAPDQLASVAQSMLAS